MCMCVYVCWNYVLIRKHVGGIDRVNETVRRDSSRSRPYL